MGKVKPKVGLLPAEALFLVARTMAYGNGQNGRSPGDWKQVYATGDPAKLEELREKALRHLLQLQDETFDQESGLHHAAHAAADLLILLACWIKNGLDLTSAHRASGPAMQAAVQSALARMSAEGAPPGADRKRDLP